MTDLLNTRCGLSDSLGADAVIPQGSHVYWAGWLSGAVLTTANLAAAAGCIGGSGRGVSNVSGVWLSGYATPYIKFTATTDRDMSASYFASVIETGACVAGWSLTRQGIGCDYCPEPAEPMAGPVAHTGDTILVQSPTVPGGSFLDCFSSSDPLGCLGAQLGVSGGVAIAVGVLALVVLVKVVSK